MSAGKQQPGSDEEKTDYPAGKPVDGGLLHQVALPKHFYQMPNSQEFGIGGLLDIKINRVAPLSVVTLCMSRFTWGLRETAGDS